MLFIIVLDGAIRRAEIDTSCMVFTKSVQLLEFADGFDIIARSPTTVKETYTILEVHTGENPPILDFGRW